jgi:surfactin synthase thioesterase subunit
MTDGSTGRWFPPDIAAGSAKYLLFCFPHGGGGANTFRQWKAELAPCIEVVPVQLPGRECRFAEPFLTSAATVIAAILEPLSTFARQPLALFGHSMGALLAYEAAVALADRGLPPAHLFASGHNPPHRHSPELPMRGLTDQEFAELLAGFGGMPAELLDDPAMMTFLMPRLRADFEISDSYQHPPRPPIPVPITVLAGRDDPDLDIGELGRWGELTTEGVEVHVFDGGHFYHVGPNELRIHTIIATALKGAGAR